MKKIYFVANMSLGNNIRKVVTNFNVNSRIFQFSRGIKPIGISEHLEHSKCKEIKVLNQQLYLLSLSKNPTEKLCCTFPEINSSIIKSIIEPEKTIKINFKLPVKNVEDATVDPPFQSEKEIKEPGQSVQKNAATHMIRIRRKKMRKHKRKKYMKKHKAEILKREVHKFLKKEEAFEKSLKEVLDEIETFCPEKYVNKLLEEAHWEKPVTSVRGFLAPKWVIKEHLEKEKKKKCLKERIQECQK